MSEAWIACAGLLAVAALIAAWGVRRRASRPQAEYRRKALMTDNEREFHARLQTALPGYAIYPQVPMLALLEPVAAKGSKRFYARFRPISNRRVDWLIERAGRSLVIELDDRTHDRHAHRTRDGILGQAGYRVLRYESRAKPKPAQLKADIADVIG